MFGIGIEQLNRLRWMDSSDGSFVDDLRAIASYKLNGEGVERSDVALEPDARHKKDRHLGPVVPEMR